MIEKIYITIACILSAFNITNPVDQTGKEIEEEVEYEAGLVLSVISLLWDRVVFSDVVDSHPVDFKCSIKPRSDKAAELVNQAVDFHSHV